jgi:hypothetical protein
MGKNKFMPGIIQKSLIKWSAIAALGVSAYFVGYFWGHKTFEGNELTEKMQEQLAQREANKPPALKQPAHFSELVERVH